MHTVLVVIHVITCLLIIAVVLIQQGRGADIGAVFGGSSATVFGSSGAGNFLTRLTATLAAIFMLTAATLTYMGAYQVTGTVFDESLPQPPPRQAPQQPAAPEPQAEAPVAPAAEAPAAEAPAAAPAAEAPAAAAPAAGGEQPAVPQAAGSGAEAPAGGQQQQ